MTAVTQSDSTILIIDDNADTIRLLSAMVRGQARVLFATNGAAGIDIARLQRPQLILLDVEMAGMDGFAVCDVIRRDPALRSSAIIFVTAQSSPEAEIACLDAGAVDFIPKPLNAAVVQARVRTHLRLQAALATLDGLAHQDGLTGLFNRRHFDSQLATEFARHRRHGMPLGLALVDVDHFKLYNDQYGHQQGDACLKAVAGAIREGARRPGELAARYGGEEFVVLLPNTRREELLTYGDWLCSRVTMLDLPHPTAPTAPAVTISVGLCSMLPAEGDTPEALLHKADMALYEAKAAGRNRGVVAGPD
ncbi:diguanylate cyclase domain-containing protein [Pseudoduganella plicata]|uniref:diguanylate cyclase n=1 Tax=Pseudoduganella plicata TaxID=321984 RepID=A0A4P7BBW5_9BURK|nr:diguanylate cyclase [Pseudoduganella plicata]QBQ35357.1 diguanylate cyclase [Pseudoduganella plicata]GGZ01083.1 diguanylate cyclase response regulator [Pseudoduganella plicata]